MDWSTCCGIQVKGAPVLVYTSYTPMRRTESRPRALMTHPYSSGGIRTHT